VTNPFGVPDREYAAGYHTGVDFAVDSGTPLLAVGDGTVVSAGWQVSYGNTVVLRLDDGKFALYAHMSALDVQAGQQVSGGQRIGASGSTGNSTGPHLHFEIRTANRYGAVIDPIAYLSGHGASNF
jgi:murein DD-endopeptidase MepM/ murein hydrolase activator NlpD